MFSGNAEILAALGIYCCSMRAIGIWARRSHDSVSGYFLAGRSPFFGAGITRPASGLAGWSLLPMRPLAASRPLPVQMLPSVR